MKYLNIMQYYLKKRVPGFSILQVFVLIVIFGIVALIIQSLINSYQANLKRQQLLNSRDLIAEMMNGSLINSVAAISYTISKCTESCHDVHE